MYINCLEINLQFGFLMSAESTNQQNSQTSKSQNSKDELVNTAKVQTKYGKFSHLWPLTLWQSLVSKPWRHLKKAPLWCVVLFKLWHKEGCLVEAGQGFNIFCWSHSRFWMWNRQHRAVTHGGSSLIPLQLLQGLLQPSKQPREDIARAWFQPRISVLNPQTHSMVIMPTVTWCIYECVYARFLPGFTDYHIVLCLDSDIR